MDIDKYTKKQVVMIHELIIKFLLNVITTFNLM